MKDILKTSASKIGCIADKCMRTEIAECKPLSLALEESGDMLLLDNWRMVHARAPVPIERKNRKLERVYLEALH